MSSHDVLLWYVTLINELRNIAGWIQFHMLNALDQLASDYAKQKHLGCKKGEANQKQQLSAFSYIATCNLKLGYQVQAKN